MKTMRLFPLELRRLLQSRLTWLMMALTVLSPVLGLALYKSATSSTMNSLYLGRLTPRSAEHSATSAPTANARTMKGYENISKIVSIMHTSQKFSADPAPAIVLCCPKEESRLLQMQDMRRIFHRTLNIVGYHHHRDT